MKKIGKLFFYFLFLLQCYNTTTPSWCCCSTITHAIAPIEAGKSSATKKRQKKSIFSTQTPRSKLKTQRAIGTISEKSSKKSIFEM